MVFSGFIIIIHILFIFFYIFRINTLSFISKMYNITYNYLPLSKTFQIESIFNLSKIYLQAVSDSVNMVKIIDKESNLGYGHIDDLSDHGDWAT